MRQAFFDVGRTSQGARPELRLRPVRTCESDALTVRPSGTVDVLDELTSAICGKPDFPKVRMLKATKMFKLDCKYL